MHNSKNKWLDEKEKYKTHLGNKYCSDKEKFIDIYSFKGCKKAKMNLKYTQYLSERQFLIDKILRLTKGDTKLLVMDLIDRLISNSNSITALENDYILGDIYELYIK